MTHIAVVEDHVKIRANLTFLLEAESYTVSAFDSAEAFMSAFDEGLSVDLILMDIRLPGLLGLDCCRQLKRKHQEIPVIVISGEASMDETVAALELGVFDFIEKPIAGIRLLQSIRHALEVISLRRRLHLLQQQEGTPLLGTSQVMSELRQTIERVAPTQARILIRGESGSGKELVAASIHARSAVREGPFIKINCAAIPAHLIEGELFGHRRGAFTDAHQDRPGVFEQAHGGTLFLDEIGDMEIPLQSRLLRVLEAGTVRRVGDTRDRPVVVRVIAATHQDLEARVEQSQFREDLYFRLATIPVDVPPLRDRLEDVPFMFRHFAAQVGRLNQLTPRSLAADVDPFLMSLAWPGNVRELKNLAERAMILGSGPIHASELRRLARQPHAKAQRWIQMASVSDLPSLKEFRLETERAYIEMVLHRFDWNITRAAAQLGLQRSYLHQKLSQLDIERPIQ